MGSRLPLTRIEPSGSPLARAPSADHVASPTTISPASAADWSRAPRLVVSPMAEKLRRPLAPMLPTTADPELTPMWKRGTSVSRSAPSRSTRARRPIAVRAARKG